MCKDHIHLRIRIRFDVSIIEGLLEGVKVGRERRQSSVICQQRHMYMRGGWW